MVTLLTYIIQTFAPNLTSSHTVLRTPSDHCITNCDSGDYTLWIEKFTFR